MALSHGMNIPHISRARIRSKSLQRYTILQTVIRTPRSAEAVLLTNSLASSWLAFGHACVAQRELVLREIGGTSLHSQCEG
jgi:hypothetical protein